MIFTPRDFSDTKIKATGKQVEEYKNYIAMLLSEYIETMKVGLGYLDIIPVINENDKTQLDFYAKDGTFLHSHKFTFPKTKAQYIEMILLASMNKIVIDFKSKKGGVTVVAETNGDNKNFIFGCKKGRVIKEIKIGKQYEAYTHAEASICGHRDFGDKTISVTDMGGFRAFHVDYNDFDGIYKNHKRSNGPKKEVGYNYNFVNSRVCDVSAHYWELFGQRAVHDAKYAGITTQYHSYSEKDETSDEERLAKFAATAEKVPNIVSHPRSKELIGYAEKEMDTAMPGIIEFFRHNFPTYRFITDAEHINDDELDSTVFLSECELPSDGANMSLVRRNQKSN